MWRSRAPPLPLDFDAIRNGTFVLREPAKQQSTHSNGKVNGTVNGSKSTEKILNGASDSSPATTGGLKDQRTLTLADNLALLVSRCVFSVLVLQQCRLTTVLVPTDWLHASEMVRIPSHLTKMTMIPSTLSLLLPISDLLRTPLNGKHAGRSKV